MWVQKLCAPILNYAALWLDYGIVKDDVPLPWKGSCDPLITTSSVHRIAVKHVPSLREPHRCTPLSTVRTARFR
jgi:hypothetical protein